MGIQERKEREKEARKEEILSAAIGVFSERSLSDATMDEIAEKAELSKGTLYLYYKSKEDLYLEFIHHGMKTLLQMFEVIATSNKSTLEKIIALGDVYNAFFREHRPLFRSFHYFSNPQFQLNASEEMKNQCAVQSDQLWNMVTDMFQDAQEKGLIRKDIDPRETGVIFWSSSNALLMRIDYEDERWKTLHGIDLRKTLELSNRLLFESILTPEGKALFKKLPSRKQEHAS